MLLITSDQCLFSIVPLNRAVEYRASEVIFGILPFPKYDETMESYNSLDWSGFLCVPNTITNEEMVGSVVELLAYYSAETTIPAYYEELLGARLSDAPEDKRMIALIFSNIVVDPGAHFIDSSAGASHLFNLFYVLPWLPLQKNSTDFASYYATYKDSAQDFLDTISGK